MSTSPWPSRKNKALGGRDIARFNRLYDRKKAIHDELQARHGDERRALLRLFDHPNTQVRLNAAEALTELEPERAKAALQAIAASKHAPQSGDAGMSLRLAERGY